MNFCRQWGPNPQPPAYKSDAITIALRISADGMHVKLYLFREKGRNLTTSYDESPFIHRKIQTETRQHKKRNQNFDNTTIADRLRTVSWSNSTHSTGVVKPVYERSNFPLTAKNSVINCTWHDRNIDYNTKILSQRWKHVNQESMKHFYTILQS